MRPFRRRERVPDHVRQAVELAPGERVLAAAAGAAGTYLVASGRALHVVTATGTRRIRWDLVDRAQWEPPWLLLEVRPHETAPVATQTYEVDRTVDLPAVVRDLVTNSIIVNSRIDVAGGHARVLARRNTDTGRLQWRVVFGPGVDAADETVQEAARREMADLRSRLGV